MKIKYLKFRHWLLATIAAVAGITVGCDDHNIACEYGTPEAEYHIRGQVLSPEGNPIPGIEVQQYGSPVDTTDGQGSFAHTAYNHFPGESFPLVFIDIDSAENGSYQDTTVVVDTKEVDLTGGDGNWNQGSGTIDLTVTMTPKSGK